MILAINLRSLLLLSSLLLFGLGSVYAASDSDSALQQLFVKEGLTDSDSVLVSNATNQRLFAWQADKLLIPASLTKLVTAHLAIRQWGLGKRFETHFFRHGHTLWIKGYGDPFLVSEEIELIVLALREKELGWVRRIAVDGSHFLDQSVPGRSNTADPYNAPLAAISANFNTAKLRNSDGKIVFGEPQTPVTEAAIAAARHFGRPQKGKTERVNLINSEHAANNFAQILAAKLDLDHLPLQIGLTVPEGSERYLLYKNSHTLADVVRGTLEFSNNFMANQLFLMLADTERVTFDYVAKQMVHRLRQDFAWQQFAVVEGAGLSRENRLSAQQIDDLLKSLVTSKSLFKPYKVTTANTLVRAKTGSLNDVHSFAGYINIAGRDYRFVFNFNRKVPYRYREALLDKLVATLAAEQE